MSRVLITGGAGFLGSHLSDLILANGHEVVAMDNLITGSDPDNVGHLFGNPKFTFIKHDVSNYIYVPGPISTTSCTSPRRRARSTTCSCPSRP